MGDHVFVCYAREDEDFVLKLAANLKGRGVPIWLDQWDIQASADWDLTIDNALYDCARFLIVLSPSARESREVRGELRTALDENKTILPVIYRKCRIPRQLRTIQYVDFASRGPDHETALEEVLSALDMPESPPPEPEEELHPSLALELSAKQQTVDVRDEATWTVTLRNDGNDDLRHVTVRRGRRLLDEPFDLVAGKGRRFSFSTTYRTEGQKTVKITVTAIASSGESVRDESSATVQVRPPRPEAPEPEAKRKPPAKPKPEVLTITSPIHLELVLIPAGEFTMGSDEGLDDEKPAHEVYLDAFYIGKFPITNVQYKRFVDATGREPPSHWSGGSTPEGKETHPVVYVSWHDALAYCRWLSRETGQEVRLPTEAEWEKAARGTDGREYPWGNDFDESKCTTHELEIPDTTPVGKYSPKGDSPYGVADMAGNVFEWTSSLHKGYPYDPDDGREDPEVEGWRVSRGGAFSSDMTQVIVTRRWSAHPDGSFDDFGLRVVLLRPDSR